MSKTKCAFCGRNVNCSKTISQEEKMDIEILGVKIREYRIQERRCLCGAKGTTTVYIGETYWEKDDR